MVTVGEATQKILEHLFKPGVVHSAVLAAAGKVLAGTVRADRDFPPFDRVAMDGIAFRLDAWLQGRRTFAVESTQAAGAAPLQLSDPVHCIEVMTGAVLPSGCDVVVRYEDVTILDGVATVQTDQMNPWQNVHRRGADAAGGEVLLEPGLVLSPAEVALLAATGNAEVPVYGFPKTALISSGDELVGIDVVPGPQQIRRSNTYALEAAMQEMGWPASQYHFADDEQTLKQALKEIAATYDVLVLSGGVSKGRFDFIPGALEQAGIRRVFHQVSQRPGKPFWFGASSSGKVAFALPGNPVSTFMCFYRYVKPWMRASMGVADARAAAVLAADYTFPPPLTCFLQVAVRPEDGRLMAYPVAGGGSGDFANLKHVTGFLELPLEKTRFARGEVFPYISFRH